MLTKATLITHNELELPCVIFPTKRPLFPCGYEVMVYCQGRLVRGYIESDDEDIVAELEIMVDWCIIPECDELLKNDSYV